MVLLHNWSRFESTLLAQEIGFPNILLSNKVKANE